LSKAKTSKPDNSATTPQPSAAFDKLYWLRLGFAALGGIGAAELVGIDFTSGISIGIAMYLVSYYLARFTWYRGSSREIQGKIYTTGIGGFVLLFLFTWLLIFTFLHP